MSQHASPPAASREQIERLVEDYLDRGPGEMLRDRERARGNALVFPGEVAWLPESDWQEEVVVSIDRRRRVRIVVIAALRPGTGAFSRMVAGILADGMKPVVVAPIGAEMPAIMKRWGWHHRTIGSSFEDREDQWFPTAGWVRERLDG